jgi:hypothetical protein
MNGLMIAAALGVATVAQAQASVLIDFGSDTTFRGVTAPSPDANGNHWNSTGFGFLGNLVDSSGVATTIDWAPDGLGGVDSFNGISGATSNPLTAGEIAAAQTVLDGGTLGAFGIAEVAMDFYVSNNGTSSVGRFQLQQVTEGQLYDLAFYSARQFTGTNTQTTFSVFDDASYSNLLGSVTVTHGDGGSNANITDIGVISGITGPANTNNIFYVQWEGVTDSTAGYINAMSITAVPEPSAYALMLGLVAGLVLLRRRCRNG